MYRFFVLTVMSLASLNALADPDCDTADHYTATIYCNSRDGEIKAVRKQIEDNLDFIRRWRIENNSDDGAPSALQSAIEHSENILMNGQSAILTLSEIECSIEDPIGYEPFSGSAAANPAMCFYSVYPERILDFLGRMEIHTRPIRPSYDCAEASTRLEIAICRSDTLSELELSMSEHYSEAEERALDINELAKSQERWVANVEDKCFSENENISCLSHSITERIIELKKFH